MHFKINGGRKPLFSVVCKTSSYRAANKVYCRPLNQSFNLLCNRNHTLNEKKYIIPSAFTITDLQSIFDLQFNFPCTVKSLIVAAAARLLLIFSTFRGQFYLVNSKRLLKVRLLIKGGYYQRLYGIMKRI